MLKVLLIALGGAVGTLLRYALAGWVQHLAAPVTSTRAVFPWGTLSVNAVGCLSIGFLGALFYRAGMPVRPEYRIALLIGLLGGFTTFSTFAWETLALASDGQGRAAALNIVLSNAIGLGLAWLGYRLGVWAFGAA